MLHLPLKHVLHFTVTCALIHLKTPQLWVKVFQILLITVDLTFFRFGTVLQLRKKIFY